MNFEWDLDDELSYCYLQKDMNKFWKSRSNVFPKKYSSFAYKWAESIAEKFKVILGQLF